MNNTTLDFWERLKQVLKTHNTTMKSLSVSLGYSEKTFNVKQSTGVLPTTTDIIRICNMFDTSADYLLLGKLPELPEHTVKLAESILELPESMQDTVFTLVNNLKGIAGGTAN